MRQLVQDDLRALEPLRLGGRVPEQEAVVEGDRADVLHGADVELGHEQLVVLGEGVGLVEEVRVVVEALAGDLEQLVGTLLELACERPAAEEPERDALVLGPHDLVRAGDERQQVGAEALPSRSNRVPARPPRELDGWRLGRAEMTSHSAGAVTLSR